MTTKRIVSSLLGLGSLVAACSSTVEPPENGPAGGRRGAYRYEGATPAVGDNIEVSVSSGERGERQVGVEAAGFLRLHFASLDLTPGTRLVVESSDGERLYFAADSNGPDLWAPALSGARASVRLEREGEGPTGSYAIDLVGVGSAEGPDSLGPVASICGTNDLIHAVCFVTPGQNPFNQTVYNTAKAVAQLTFAASGGTGFCTGFLISNTNLLLTNYHCIPNQAAADTLTTTFNFQSSICDSLALMPKESISGATFLAGSALLDYALVRLPTNQVPPQNPPGSPPLNAAAKYGFIAPDPAPDLRVDETEIYIPQHPGTATARKKIGYKESQAGDTCRVRAVGVDLDGGGEKPPVNVGYRCDTQGGSSGSPVVSLATHKVVALHHEGACPAAFNYGVTFSAIYPEIRCHVEGTECTGGTGGSGGGGAPADSCTGRCGQQAPAGCFCDPGCHSTDDCCPDKDQQCGTGVPETSCEGRCVGSQQAPSGCWCDPNCHNFGDCCADRDLFCGGP